MLAGVGSSLLTAALGQFDGAGLIFGLALSVYFTLYEKRRDFGKMAVFVILCGAAFPLSVLVGGNIGEHLASAWSLQSTFESQKSFLALSFTSAGFIGASLVLTAGVFSLGPSESTRRDPLLSLMRALICSFGGAALGFVAAWFQSAVFLVWQPGVALILGMLLRWERHAGDIESRSDLVSHQFERTGTSRIVQIIFVATFVAIVGSWGYIELTKFHTSRVAARQYEESEARIKRQLAGRPPLVVLPAIRPVELDEALILDPVDGLFPVRPESGMMSVQPDRFAPYKTFSVEYRVTKVEPSNFAPGVAVVRLKEAPNGEWAKYYADYSGDIQQFPPRVKRVEEFGQSLNQDTSRKGLFGVYRACFDWPSDDFAVSICFPTSINEAILKEYLRKYPSAW